MDEKEILELCDSVRQTAFDLHTFLRHGHLEKVYENGLARRLRKKGVKVKPQHPLQVRDEDSAVLGDYFADLFVENNLIVELKACKTQADEDTTQVLGYLRASAGFLISAYKHILGKNQPQEAQKAQNDFVPSVPFHGHSLTPDERARLMTNFRGYDIAPDMVRLSRANLYLHGFPNPVIHEYDTLTSEERWDERCDVIMANPPFMTPKGGIRPHNRFSIKAKRSEVLFVDYIAEHLNPGGRAASSCPKASSSRARTLIKPCGRCWWKTTSGPSCRCPPVSSICIRASRRASCSSTGTSPDGRMRCCS
ncbi:MAG: GxxExxY protein [Acidobacteria bacterium]|nr:GxxExxY protein [Acidobacteriota bacterium]